MSDSLGNRLPDRLLQTLHWENPERKNSAIFILTVDETDRPHVALLSPFQVVTVRPELFYLAVHRGTRSQQFLERQKKGTLIVQLQPAVQYIKFKVNEIPEWESIMDNVLYAAEPVEVLEDSSEKVPFISELKFDSSEIIEIYTTAFREIADYISRN